MHVRPIKRIVSKLTAAAIAVTQVIWQPIPGSSQELALNCPCHHILFHGTRGPGKTITQLMRFRRRVGIGYGVYWRGVIFDREFKNLSDLVAQSKREFSKFNDGAKFLESASEYKWVWPTGEELLFRHVKKISDYDGYHGHEYPFMGWNELTKYPTPELYEKFMSCNRSSFVPKLHAPFIDEKNGIRIEVPEIPLEVFSTTNSNGAGHAWVKRRFINPAASGEIVEKKSIVFDPRIQAEREVVKMQVAIFGSYRENIFLPAEYVAELDAIKDPNLRAAWLYGSWDVISGGAFDDLWKREVHEVPRFVVPPHWYINRSFDWGSTHPFAVHWWAEADGTEVTFPDGSKWCPVRGSLICIAEWYACIEIGLNKGVKMSAGDIAIGIMEREIKWMETGWFLSQPLGGPADNQIRQVREIDVETIEKKMEDKGIRWTDSDKSPGSRVIGLQLFRDRLEAAIRGEGPAVYFTRNCEATIEILPSLERDPDKPDDIDTDAEDHVWDSVRYRVLTSTNRYTANIASAMAH